LERVSAGSERVSKADREVISDGLKKKAETLKAEN
jgi:hypothetical protein